MCILFWTVKFGLYASADIEMTVHRGRWEINLASPRMFIDLSAYVM